MHGEFAGAGLEQISMGPTVAEDVTGRNYASRNAIRLREIDSDRAKILANQTALTADQRTELQLLVIAAEHRLKVTQAQNDEDKKDLADLEAMIASSAVVRARDERTSAAAGLQKAAQDIADEWGSIGTRMQEGLHQSAGALQQTLAGIFRGDRVARDFARDFGNTLKSVLADEVSKLLIGTVVGSVRGLLLGGGGGGNFFGSALNLVAGGGGAGILAPPRRSTASTSAASTMVPAVVSRRCSTFREAA